MPGAIRVDSIIENDAAAVLGQLPARSIDLAIWSPPYLVGKSYESGLDTEGWKKLLSTVLAEHGRVLRAGSFAAINVGDNRAWPDPSLTGFHLSNPARHLPVTKADVLRAQKQYPDAPRELIASVLGVSEQTVSRRAKGASHRRQKGAQTRIRLGVAELHALTAGSGLELYDYRIWKKPPCWTSCPWHSQSYRAVDEFEHLLLYRTRGPGAFHRERLTREEWAQWGSRAVWDIPSVQANTRHEAEFPEKLVERIVQLLSEPGDTVLDAFVGSGTTTAVARRMRRRWIGIEQDPSTAAQARQRTLDPRYDPRR